MKKIVSIVILFAMLCVCLASCGDSNSFDQANEKVDNTVEQNSIGLRNYSYVYQDYHLNSFGSNQEFLVFLADFDYESNEIIDISHSSNSAYILWKTKDSTTTESHSHTWDVKAVDGEFISFCTECGKIAE